MSTADLHSYETDDHEITLNPGSQRRWPDVSLQGGGQARFAMVFPGREAPRRQVHRMAATACGIRAIACRILRRGCTRMRKGGKIYVSREQDERDCFSRRQVSIGKTRASCLPSAGKGHVPTWSRGASANSAAFHTSGHFLPCRCAPAVCVVCTCGRSPGFLAKSRYLGSAFRAKSHFLSPQTRNSTAEKKNKRDMRAIEKEGQKQGMANVRLTWES